MSRIRYLAWAGFVLGGLVIPWIAGATADAEWFAEDADSFVENAEFRWRYAAEVATVESGKICFSNTSGEDDETRYVRGAVTNAVQSMDVVYTACFESSGSLEQDIGVAIYALQIVPRIDSMESGPQVFALHNPAQGTAAWTKTSTSARLNYDYQIKIELRFDASGKTATYYFRDAGSSSAYTKIGSVILPITVSMPKEFAFAGKGSISSFVATIGDEAAVNRATVSSGSASWNSITWDSTWVVGGEAIITVTKDTVLDLNGAENLPFRLTIVGDGSASDHAVTISSSDGRFNDIEIVYGDGVVAQQSECRWIGGEAGNWNDAANWSTLKVPSRGDRVVFDSRATVTADASAAAGTMEISAEATVSFPASLPAVAAFAGSGRLKLCELPTGISVDSLRQSSWHGTLWLNGIDDLNAFTPDDYGNDKSVVGFSDCTGYLCKGMNAVKPALAMYAGSEGVPSLRFTSAFPGESVKLSSLAGDGSLKFETSGTSEQGYDLEVDDFSGFVGSIEIAHGDLLLGENGSYAIAEDQLWATYDGELSVTNGASIQNRGAIGGKVTGEGTVVYTGELGADKIESAAEYTEPEWRGKVVVKDATLNEAVLARGGNAGSSMTIESAVGVLGSQYLGFPVTLSGNGLEITEAIGGAVFRVDRLLGDGALVLDSGDAGYGVEQFRFDAVDEYLGRIKVGAGDKAVGIGDVDYTAGGAIDFANEVVVPAGLGWRAQSMSFGEKLYVTNSVVGDTLGYATLSPGNYSSVTVHFKGGEIDERLGYGLDFNDYNGALDIVAISSPPSMDAKLDIDYGVDLTNATLTLTITNFVSGLDYTGGVYANVIVRRADGRAVRIYSVDITGDGVFLLGTLALPGGDAKNYVFELSVEARKSAFDQEEIIDSYSEVNPSAHLALGEWVHENASTFALPTEDAVKTGTWDTEGGGTVEVVDDAIELKCGEGADQRANFTAKTRAKEDIVKLDVSFAAKDGDVKNEPTDDACGMFLMEGPDAYGKYLLSGYNPEINTNEFLYGAEIYDGDTSYHVIRAVFNYTEGTLSYQLDGQLLSTKEGKSIFKLSDTMMLPENRVRRVSFSGNGYLDSIEGNQFTGDIAETVTVSGDVTTTNRFATLDDAVQSVTDATTKVSLLWDATWHPQANDVGRTFGFDTAGFRLIVDEATTNKLVTEGYTVIDNGNGTYTIGVVEYSLILAKNDLEDGDSETKSQYYSVTNTALYLKPIAECFSREGFDFRKWNAERDGSGATNWSDGAYIDMADYGLTNMTIYAQWTVKIRAIRIEATDPSVYVEKVSTNGVEHAGVRYFKPDGDAAVGYQAEVPVENGCADLVIRFSTDIEKRLSSSYIKKSGAVTGDELVLKEFLPTNLVADANGEYAELNPIHTWAASHFVSQAVAALSPYALASSKLDAETLITEKSEVVISSFSMTDAGCAFKVTVDGKPLGDPSALAGMVRISRNLVDWEDAELRVVGDDGSVEVVTDDPGAFVKIVIPEN